MASKNSEDLRYFDWDDTALIKAYNKGTKLREKGFQKIKTPKKGNSTKENKRATEPWKVGDACRAEFSADQLLYEADICYIKDDSCRVQFVGYGDVENVKLADLLESAGKKARRRQTKAARVAGYAAPSDSGSTDVESGSHRSYSAPKSFDENQLNNELSAADTLYHITHNSQAFPSHPHPATNHSHGPACYAPPAAPNLPFLSTSSGPPMPQCPSLSQNPGLSAMLVSWYMAGYYTGIHQGSVNGQKGTHCTQHCCSHANRCCH